jgi:hypothetical protein
MPEEINRVVTDSITNWFFTTSETANANLRRSGVSNDRIFFVGNTMIDTLQKQLMHLRPPTFWNELGLRSGRYFVVTLHRPANVDSERQLVDMLRAIAKGTRGMPVVFPVHPRTSKRLAEIADDISGLHYVEPQAYLEFNYMVKHAKGVITDSGGITEETTVMGVPCMTLRENTERPETVTIGTNELVDRIAVSEHYDAPVSAMAGIGNPQAIIDWLNDSWRMLSMLAVLLTAMFFLRSIAMHRPAGPSPFVAENANDSVVTDQLILSEQHEINQLHQETDRDDSVEILSVPEVLAQDRFGAIAKSDPEKLAARLSAWISSN